MFTKKSEETNWLTIADMMTALMVIFMFIAINFIVQVIEHTYVKDDIYNKLELTFKEDIKKGVIELGPDGSIRFDINQNQKLFETGEAEPLSNFKKVLKKFIPKYWDVLKSDTTYFNYIKEIRIEGHADTKLYFKKTDTLKTKEVSYLNNLELSQKRAANVLKFLREQPIYIDATTVEKERMDFLFTSIGFSNSRAINKKGNYVYLDSLKKPDNLKSRRVEFRIVTSNGELIEKILNEK